jgi:hypothetical protein
MRRKQAIRPSYRIQAYLECSACFSLSLFPQWRGIGKHYAHYFVLRNALLPEIGTIGACREISFGYSFRMAITPQHLLEEIMQHKENQMTYEITNISWDQDNHDTHILPNRMVIFAESEEDLADLISDETGYCHHGFEYKIMEG